MHYKRHRKTGSTDDTKLRSKHVTAEVCSVSNCGKKALYYPDLCQMHWRRWKKWGVAEDDEVKAVKWKDYKGRYKYTNGYVYLYWPEHPNAKSGGTVAEHHVVMSEKLGRPLDLANESVHHKNGIKDDNRPENLELWGRYQPAGQRVEDLVDFSIEILRKYRPELLVELVRTM